MSVFLFLNKIDEEKASIEVVHYMPELLSETELQQGVMVDEFVEVAPPEGKIALPYWSYKTQEVFYEYIDRPLSETELLKQELEFLKAGYESLQMQVVRQEQLITELSVIAAK